LMRPVYIRDDYTWVLRGSSIYEKNYVVGKHSYESVSLLYLLYRNAWVVCLNATLRECIKITLTTRTFQPQIHQLSFASRAPLGTLNRGRGKRCTGIKGGKRKRRGEEEIKQGKRKREEGRGIWAPINIIEVIEIRRLCQYSVSQTNNL